MIKKVSNQKLDSHKLVLTVPQTELIVMNLSKKKFDKYSSKGISEDDYEDLLYELENHVVMCSPIYVSVDPRLSLTVDDSKISNFAKKFKQIYSDAVKNTNLIEISKTKTTNKINDEVDSYAIVWDRFYKRTYHEVIINEEFEIGKLRVEIDVETLPNSDKHEGFVLFYGDAEFQLAFDNGFDSDSIYIVNSKNKNKVYSLEINYDLDDE
jgi:hypothetical protein